MPATGTGPTVRVDVLGPLRLLVDGVPVDVRGPKRWAVLAVLAVAGGRAVTVDHLLDELWPADLPESARGALHSHVSRLRRHLGGAGTRLRTLDGAYRLALGIEDLDAAMARTLLAQARERASDDPAGAGGLLRAARALWRGPVLGEFADVPALAATATDLGRLHQDVTDLLVATALETGELDAGATDGVLGLAAEAVHADPLREPAVLLWMRALAATGQASRAMHAAREYRRRLGEEVGLDPSAALGELERAIAGGTVTVVTSARAATTAATSDQRRRAAGHRSDPATPARSGTPMVGREAQVAAVQRLSADERLVTVVGPGGVGKTRLALEVARRRDAAAVVSLASVTEAAAMPDALAAALELSVVHGDVMGACVELLRAGTGLLVLDNCEHLLDAVRNTVEVVLAGCPELGVLTTSREPLGLAMECPFRLAPLPLPAAGASDPAEVADAPSVRVFLDRATRARYGFVPDGPELSLVATIVRRLDGIPLAIELAAGRLSTFSLSELAERLDRALDLLTGGRPTADARHRALRSTVEWSYRLLPDEERRLFRHLSVFVDGFDLAGAENMACELGLGTDPAGALAHLVDASMVEASLPPTGVERPTRYRMLETMRAFGLDQLTAAGERDAAAELFLAWARSTTAWIDATSVGEAEARADAALRREQANLRAAWHMARSRDALDAAVAIVASLYDVTAWRDLPEIRSWAEQLALDPALPAHPQATLVLAAAARATYMRGDSAATRQHADAALDLARDETARWHGLRAVALAALSRGAFGEVVEHETAGAALAVRPNPGLGIAALAATYDGDLEKARDLHGGMAAEAASPTLRAFTEYAAGEIDNAAAAPGLAGEHYTRSIALARSSGATFVVNIASVGLLSVLLDAGRVGDALRGYREVIDYFAETGNWPHLWTTLRNLARLLRELDDHEPADLLDAAADHAPDAPRTAARPRAAGDPPAGRVRALAAAREAIDAHLGSRPGPGGDGAVTTGPSPGPDGAQVSQ
ncbi:MAG: winged helix-turn-helix domain-containing protein [Actinomycetota bacterium]|nr:winged helix-turn-helix domain-containing protein [Actinomycetota bacterium]